MQVIEFLDKTERKNIQNIIGMKVKQKLLEYDEMLNERRQKLKDILESENVQQNEELVMLAREKLNEQMRKRLNWVNTKCMERIQAEEELIKLKIQQRELDNCEGWRHLQSKQLLLDTKQGQLYQIEDKKLRLAKEKEIDRNWHDTMQRVNSEREYQEIYGKKLLKVIERANQLKNQQINDNNKKQQQQENQQTKNEYEEQNQKALVMEENYRKDEKRKEFLNKIHQKHLLKSQILSNCERRTLEDQLQLTEAHLQNEIEDRKIFSEIEQTKQQKIFNKKCQTFYLDNVFNEKQQKIKEETEFEQMYLNTGCVLQQSSKKPYRKSAR